MAASSPPPTNDQIEKDSTIMHSRKHPNHNPEAGQMREETTEEIAVDNSAGNDAESEKLLPLHHAPSDDIDSATAKPLPPSQAKKIGTALFYATSSLGVIFANKIVLSTYKFPSVQTLALLQFTSTTIALKVASMLGYVNLLPISVKGIKSILPLSTCYLLNILTGLSATQNLSLPMMVLLRRASILMTMVSWLCINITVTSELYRLLIYVQTLTQQNISLNQLLEKWMLNSQPSKTVQLSVGLMLGVSFEVLHAPIQL